jgi:hypothetical protein
LRILKQHLRTFSASADLTNKRRKFDMQLRPLATADNRPDQAVPRCSSATRPVLSAAQAVAFATYDDEQERVGVVHGALRTRVGLKAKYASASLPFPKSPKAFSTP